MNAAGLQQSAGGELRNREIVRGLGVGNAIKVLLVTAAVAGVFGWLAAKWRFEDKQRVRAEMVRVSVEQERKRFADAFAEAVRRADEVEIEDYDHTPGTPNKGKIVLRFSDPAWNERFAAVLAGGTYTTTEWRLMVTFPQVRFYEAKKVVFCHELGDRLSLPGRRFEGREVVVTPETADALRRLVSEKRL